jgi:acetyl-CoA carboxylase biotin carboxylase subunit
MGIQTVAVFSEADRGAHYLKLADEAYCIGPAPAADSYLMINRIISAAEIGNVQAIHPGYGFLAENAHFAEVCRSCNIEFIGPPTGDAETGDKVSADHRPRRQVLWSRQRGLVTTEQAPSKPPPSVPVLIKATAGAAKGMRVAMNDIGKAGRGRRRAESVQESRGYLEKYIENPRHVEVQILADNHGNVIHLWERDCSLQRRHQKLVEESPAPALPHGVREDICKSAVRLVKSAGYTNAGTVEFIVDKDNNFYFIEVNARIQVEHTVTEAVTGIDLVQMQIRIANGEKLEIKQKSVPCNGSAIELRVNAEDPENGFRGSPGRITTLRVPGGLGVRFDSHVHEGYTIGPHYDSLIGKLIVHRPTRAESLACMRRALDEFVIEGIKTTIPLARKIFSHSAFVEGQVDTTFIERTF